MDTPVLPTDPNAPPVLPSASLLGGGAPNIPPVQVNAPQVQMAQPTQAQPQTPQAPNPATPTDPNVMHDTLFGRAAKTLLGHTTSYSIDKNGNTVASQTPQAPGQFFKNIIAAAVLGGAAGASGNPEQGFMGGLARGGAAGVGYNQQQDALKQQQAQQQFVNQKNAQELQMQQQNAAREQTLAEANVAAMHAEIAARQQNTDLLSKEYHDKHNAASAAMEGALRSAGGLDAQIPVDGKVQSIMTAPALAEAYVKDPSIRRAPDGYVRHFIDTTDASEVNWNGTNWVEADGTPVNMSDKTTVKAIDVPLNAMQTQKPTTGKTLNAALGQNLWDPDKSYSVSPNDLNALNTQRLKAEQEKAKTELEKKQVAIDAAKVGVMARQLNHSIDMDNKTQFGAVAKEIGERIQALQTQVKDPMIDPDVKKNAQAQIDNALKEFKEAREQMFPKTKWASDTSMLTAPKVAHPDVVSILTTIPGFDPSVAEQIGNMSPDAIRQQLATASSIPQATKDKILQSLGMPLVTAPEQKPDVLANAVVTPMTDGWMGAATSVGASLGQKAAAVGSKLSARAALSQQLNQIEAQRIAALGAPQANPDPARIAAINKQAADKAAQLKAQYANAYGS